MLNLFSGHAMPRIEGMKHETMRVRAFETYHVNVWSYLTSTEGISISLVSLPDIPSWSQ